MTSSKKGQGAQAKTAIVVVGARLHPLRDIYHLLLRASWPTEPASCSLRRWSGMRSEDDASQEVEVMVSVSGVDETAKGPVHAVHTCHQSLLHQHRFVDVLTERSDGTLVLDVRRFHDVAPL